MQSEKQQVVCPLCHGHGRNQPELLVMRWRSKEFEKELQQMADEAAFESCLDVVFEEEPVCSNEAD
jgi:hypothetical protein